MSAIVIIRAMTSSDAELAARRRRKRPVEHAEPWDGR
jgi:hypothetical protein